MNSINSTSIEKFRKNQKNNKGPMVTLQTNEDSEWKDMKKDLSWLGVGVLFFGSLMWLMFFGIGISH